jgi:hypothetical protein
MKNISLFAKITILVAVLAVSCGIVAFVGVRQLARAHERLEVIVNDASRSARLASMVRVELLRSIRAEKNAVMVEDKVKATEFADHARQALVRLDKELAELQSIVEANPATPEGKALLDFDRALDEFVRNGKEVLRLAVVKSNGEAKFDPPQGPLRARARSRGLLRQSGRARRGCRSCGNDETGSRRTPGGEGCCWRRGDGPVLGPAVPPGAPRGGGYRAGTQPAGHGGSVARGRASGEPSQSFVATERERALARNVRAGSARGG